MSTSKAKTKVLIGLSWPYANGRLHIGHVASSLPADAIARFHRKIGNDVSFITGSDCFGTPILVAALKEAIAPEDLAGKYHELHKKDFASMGFTFDNYTATMFKPHLEFVQKFHSEMYKGDYIYEKTAPQLYCEECHKYLPDRYVEGICPFCKKPAKGDSCDNCGKILEPEDLLEPKCKLCGATPKPRSTSQLYLKLSALEPKIREFFEARKNDWTINAQGMTERYISEGLRDRAITRNIEWGVHMPKGKYKFDQSDWDEKRIYIWAENVLGYLSASKSEFIHDQKDKEKSDHDQTPTPTTHAFKHYYVHGKDNIPFHSIILPGLILAHGNGDAIYHLPDVIVASEYITVGGDKLSKSKGNQIFAYTLYENFNVDMVRYFFLSVVSDKRDSNFSWDEFVNIINGELVNNFGNLVNRTLSFIKTKFDGLIPSAPLEEKVEKEIESARTEHADLMWHGKTANALNRAMALVNFGNKYFADKKPWITEDKGVIANVVQIIAAAVDMLEPFIPTASQKVQKWLDGNKLGDIEILFERLNKNEIRTN